MSPVIESASPPALRRIGLQARSETRFFMVAVARLLKERHGAAIVLYCGNPQEVAFYRKHGEGVFEAIVEAKVLHRAAMEPPHDEAEEVARAQAFETRIGHTINFLSVSNRHLGRGYALGGFRHPRSRISENTSYVNLLHAYNECLGFWDREIAERGLTLILNGPRESAVMARAHDVPYRVMAGSRYRSYANWAWNEYFENPEIEAAFRCGVGPQDLKIERPYHSHLVNRERYLKDISAFRVADRSIRQVAKYCWWRLNGYEKAKGYFLRQNLRMISSIRSDAKRLNRLARTKLADLAHTRFVYYPLHQEPEMALQGLSPEYFFQLSLIAAIARDLPAGVRLAVKETFGAIGRRPRDFYGQIAEFKNVVMLEPMELGIECAARAEATVTICGTGGFEAAAMGKPVVALGRHNIYNFLPQVRVVDAEADLSRHLHEALGPRSDNRDWQEAGARFLGAVVARSFDMRGYDYIAVERFDPASAQEACRALASGLTFEQRQGEFATAAQ